MSVEAHDFTELARRLVTEDKEIDWRSAASRAYYAAFHLAKYAAYVCPDNSHFKIDGGTHAKLIDRFDSWNPASQELKKKSRQISYILKDMKRTREHADYVTDVHFFKQDAETKICQIDLLNKCISEVFPLALSTASSQQ